MRLVVVLVALALAACSSSGPRDDVDRGTTTSASVSTSRSGRRAAVSNTGSTTETCDPAETEQLQQALANSTPAGVNGAAAVKTKCGIRFFAVGPSSIDAKTLHRIGSISKTYVGALMAVLAHDGTVNLDDVVERWVPGVPGGDVITLRHLLTHRSGLFNQTNEPDVYLSPRTWAPEELLAIVAQHDLNFEPGTQYEYSNSNFLVAGMVAQAATGKRLSTLLHERLLEPLGLTETFFSPDDATGDLELAPAVGLDGEDVTHLNDISWAWGAGTLMATPSDVVRWIEAIGSGTFLDADTEALLLAPTPTDSPTMSIGLGVFNFDTDIGPLIGHSGYVPGYQSNALYSVDHDLTVIGIVDRDPPGDGESSNVTNALFAVLVPR